jgi:CHAT domain-containing protein
VKLGQKVSDELLGFAKDDPNAKSLIIVPDGGLHLLPFSALVSHRGKYLLEDESIGIAPSGTVLSLLRSRTPQSSANRPYQVWQHGRTP